MTAALPARQRRLGHPEQFGRVALLDAPQAPPASQCAAELVHGHGSCMKPATRSAIMMVGALVLPPTSVGITEASTTRRPTTPCTRQRLSTTAIGSVPRPILQVPTG